MCELRFASTEGSFVSAFTKLGLIAELGTRWTVPRLVGTGNVLDLLWSSRRIDAAEAYRLGLVERLTEPDALVEATRTYVDELAHQVSPIAIAEIKRLAYDHAGMEIHPAFTEAFEATCIADDRADARKGAASFVQRRPPNLPRLRPQAAT
jgi:enoyl-CoA hydratase/carnithine racemase